MFIAGLLRRRRVYVVFLIVMVGAIAVVFARQLLTDNDSIDSQAVVQDACARLAEFPEFYDVTIRGSNTQGSESMEFVQEMRINGDDIAWTVADRITGNLRAEVVIIRTSGDHRGGVAGASGVATVTTYSRESDDTGEWEDWNMSVSDYRPATGRSEAGGGSGSEIASFCGFPLESDVLAIESGYIGEETIDGVVTKRYFYSYSPKGEREDDYNREDYWVDPSNGRFVQVKQEVFVAGDSFSPNQKVEAVKTYSGWGEPNIITAPMLSSPEGAPTPMPVPRYRIPEWRTWER